VLLPGGSTADSEVSLFAVGRHVLRHNVATRGDDKVSEAAMEDRKREGYF